jgi:hypothetical protein
LVNKKRVLHRQVSPNSNAYVADIQSQIVHKASLDVHKARGCPLGRLILPKSSHEDVGS